MKNERLVRVNELIRREIAANMHRFVHGQDVNLAAITITRVVVTSNLRTARVWVSVLSSREAAGDTETPDHVLNLLSNRRKEIQAHLGRTLNLKYTPRLIFESDSSLESGDRVLDLLNHLPGLDDDDDADDLPPSSGGPADA